jgi:hypothetical protein
MNAVVLNRNAAKHSVRGLETRMTRSATSRPYRPPLFRLPAPPDLARVDHLEADVERTSSPYAGRRQVPPSDILVQQQEQSVEMQGTMAFTSKGGFAHGSDGHFSDDRRQIAGNHRQDAENAK